MEHETRKDNECHCFHVEMDHPNCSNHAVKKNLKRSLVESLVDVSSAKKRRAQNKLFQYHGYGYRLSHESSKLEEPVRDEKQNKLIILRKDFWEKAKETAS